MAHKCKCKYCGIEFDRDKEPFVSVSARRYAHPSCHQLHLDSITQEEKDEEEFYNYAKHLFQEDYNYLVTKKLAERYVKENGYTYSGMTKALKWFYEIQHNSLDKANGSIGILPYCYNTARDYYYSLYLAKRANEEKDVLKYIPKVREIEIESPRVWVKPPRLFNMEDEE